MPGTSLCAASYNQPLLAVYCSVMASNAVVQSAQLPSAICSPMQLNDRRNCFSAAFAPAIYVESIVACGLDQQWPLQCYPTLLVGYKPAKLSSSVGLRTVVHQAAQRATLQHLWYDMSGK